MSFLVELCLNCILKCTYYNINLKQNIYKRQFSVSKQKLMKSDNFTDLKLQWETDGSINGSGTVT